MKNEFHIISMTINILSLSPNPLSTLSASLCFNGELYLQLLLNCLKMEKQFFLCRWLKSRQRAELGL